MGVLCLVFVFNTVHTVLSSFGVIFLRRRELVVLLYLCSFCRVTISVLGLVLRSPWVGLWSVIMNCFGHTHLLFAFKANSSFMF